MSIPNLMDPVRNHAYEEIINDIGRFRGTLLDIGCRDSQFAAYMAKREFVVTAIERAPGYSEAQKHFQQIYGTPFAFGEIDLLSLPDEPQYDIVTAVYAIQHNIDKDIECYRKIAKLARKCAYIVNEYSHDESKVQLGRNDGDMRIYSSDDVLNRIVIPMSDIIGPRMNTRMRFNKFDFAKQEIRTSSVMESNSITIAITNELE